MAIARFQGIMVLLAAVMVSSMLSTALAAERSHAGSNPKGSKWHAYKSDGPQFTLTLPAVPSQPVKNTGSVLNTPPCPDIYQSHPGYHEASITLTDASLSASIPKEDAARRLADIVQIAQSRTVMERAVENLYRLNVTNDPMTMLQTLRIEPEPGGNAIGISVRYDDSVAAKAGAQVLAEETIARCRELSGIDAAALRIGTPEVTRIRKPFGPVIVYLWIALVAACMLLGVFVGGFLGRRHGSRRFLLIVAALIILAFSGAGIWYNKERSRPEMYSGGIILICDPASPTSIPTEIMGLAKSRDVLDRVVRVLGQLNIRATPERILAGLKTERITQSDAIQIETTSKIETEAKATAAVIAGETVKRHRQIHASDASARAVQILDPAKTQPMAVHHVANMILRFGVIPAAACLITLLIAYPISYRMSRNRRTKPKPIL